MLNAHGKKVNRDSSLEDRHFPHKISVLMRHSARVMS